MQKFGVSSMSGSQLTLADWAAAPGDNIMLSFRDGTAATPLMFGREGSSSGHSVVVPGWAHRRSCERSSDSAEFVGVGDHEATLTQMLLSHQDADFCMVGGKVRTLHVSAGHWSTYLFG